jgi:restriction system-associated AAA family ATPase
MKILRLKSTSRFRGLSKGIDLSFRNKEDNFTPEDIREPICLVGLNGSGKSNTLQTICEIFYYLELQTIADRKELKRLTSRYNSLHFEIDYTITNSKWKFALGRSIAKESFSDLESVIIQCIKEVDKEPQIFASGVVIGIRRVPLPKETWSEVLPSRVIGYSSGQNELISNAFIKLNFHYFDSFQKSSGESALTDLQLNRMFFMDYESNELVVLANFLFDHDLSNENSFKKKIRIKDLRSFCIKIRFQDYKYALVKYPSSLNIGVENLKKCATVVLDNQANDRDRKIDLFFYSDDAVKKAFKEIFKTPFELFKLLYSLRLLNIHCIGIDQRTRIKRAPQGTNLSDLIPKPASEFLLFRIEGINFIRTQGHDPIYYKQLSDGEHQLLHTIGTLKLMNESDSLFILDEPETHFNPEWRSKMVSMIVENNKLDVEMKDYFITSHSPFIISDCKPNNVYIFNKNDKDEVTVTTAAQKRINTFGTSVNILTEEIFNKNESIADYSLAILNEIKNRSFRSLKQINKAKEDARVLGDSVEKTLLFRKLILIEDQIRTKEKSTSKAKKKIPKKKTKTTVKKIVKNKPTPNRAKKVKKKRFSKMVKPTKKTKRKK